MKPVRISWALYREALEAGRKDQANALHQVLLAFDVHHETYNPTGKKPDYISEADPKPTILDWQMLTLIKEAAGNVRAAGQHFNNDAIFDLGNRLAHETELVELDLRGEL